MPKIINSYYFHSLQESFCAVAIKRSGSKGWKAYIGSCRFNVKSLDEKWVADMGAKVPKSMAMALFPEIKGEYKY